MRTSTSLLCLAAAVVAGAAPAYALGQAAAPAGTSASPQVTLAPPAFAVGRALSEGAQYCDGVVDNITVPMLQAWTGRGGTGSTASYDVTINHDEATQTVHTSGRSVVVPGTTYDDDCGGGLHPVTSVNITATGNGTATTSMRHRYWVSSWQEDGTPGNTESGATSAFTATRSGTWQTATCTCFNGGRDQWTSSAGASATYTFTTTAPGEHVALVAPTAPNRGRMSVSLDGAAGQQVDTYSATNVNRVIVWQGALQTAGQHRVVVTDLATHGRPRVDVDTVLVNQLRD